MFGTGRKLLALLALCWIRDLEISSTEEEAVSGSVYSASPGSLRPGFSGQLGKAPFLEAYPSIVVSPMLSMWS
jgi:hypothetical protein